LDRASVYGTDDAPAEAMQNQALTESGDSARSARRSADSENDPENTPASLPPRGDPAARLGAPRAGPDDCPQREPGTWCPVRVLAGLVAAGLASRQAGG